MHLVFTTTWQSSAPVGTETTRTQTSLIPSPTSARHFYLGGKVGLGTRLETNLHNQTTPLSILCVWIGAKMEGLVWLCKTKPEAVCLMHGFHIQTNLVTNYNDTQA
jgi:hypothetical protein